MNLFILIATYLGNSNPIFLDQISFGVSRFQLPNGPQADAYKIQIYVQILDDSDGITEFRLPNSLIVKPNNNLVNNLSNDLLNSNNDQNSSLISNLKTGNIQTTTTFISSFVSMLDSSSISASANQSTNSSNLNSNNQVRLVLNFKFK